MGKPKNKGVLRASRSAKQKKPESVLGVLVGARRLIARKGGWAKGAYARGRSGRPVDLTGPNAVSFCTVGAIYRAGMGVFALDACRALKPRGRPLTSFNDDRSTARADVLALFDRAIAALEGK